MGTKPTNVHISKKRLVYVLQHCPVSSQLKPISGIVITSEQLAAETGVDISTISRARTTGSISKDLLDDICSLINISKDYLLGKNDHYLSNKTLPHDFVLNLRVLHEQHKTAIDVAMYMQSHILTAQATMKEQRRIDPDGVYIPTYDDSIDFQKEYTHKEAFAKYLHSYLTLSQQRTTFGSIPYGENKGAYYQAVSDKLEAHIPEIMNNVETQSKTLPAIIETVLSDIKENNYVIMKENGMISSMYSDHITSKYLDVLGIETHPEKKAK